MPFSKIAKQLVSRPRLTMAGAGSIAAAVSTVLVRRRLHREPLLPPPGSLGSTTAIAVHNAAKGAVIGAVREADAPDGRLVSDTVHDSVLEAIRAGVDVAPAAVGAVEGSIEIAHVIGESKLAAGQRAAASAVSAAETLSPTAADRVRDILAPYLEQRTAVPGDGGGAGGD